jgi:hypothetical protein
LLDIDARKRHYHITDNGKIIKFVVQWEVRTKGFWKVVLQAAVISNGKRVWQ